MATIGSLVVNLLAETAAFRRDLGRARRDVSRFASRTNRQLGTITAGFTALGRSAKGLVGIFAATAGLRGIDQMLQSVSDLADTADKLGLTAERLQELRFAAEQTGVASNTLDMAVQRFTRRIGEAAQGGGELKDTLEQYGISVADAQGRTRDTASVMGDLAEVIRNADSDAERLRIGFKAFDSEGVALVNVLRDGRAGLEAWSNAAQRAGVLNNELVERTRRINREWRAFAQVIATEAKTRLLEGIIALRQLAEMMGLVSTSTAIAAGSIAGSEAELAGLREESARTRDELDRLLGGRTLEDMTLPPATRLDAAILTGELRELTIQIGAVESRLRRLRRLERERTETRTGTPPTPIDTAARDRIAGVTDALRFQAEQLERTAEVQRVYTEMRSAGVEADSAAGMEIRNLVERLQEIERAHLAAAEAAEFDRMGLERLRAEADAAAQDIQRGMDSIRSSSEQALSGLAQDFLAGENAMDSLANAARQTVNAIINEFLRLAVIRPLIGALFGGFGGVVGIGGTSASQATTAGGTGLLLQHGGSFIADGPGGTDAIAQRINLTKGERVTVETPAQQRQARGGNVNVTINQDLRGADAGVFARAQQIKEAITREVLETVVGGMNDGGPLAVASGRRR
jgi:hypothetical protein